MSGFIRKIIANCCFTMDPKTAGRSGSLHRKKLLMKLCFPYFSARTGSAVGRMSAGDSVECARCRVALRETRRFVQLSDRCTGGATSSSSASQLHQSGLQ